VLWAATAWVMSKSTPNTNIIWKERDACICAKTVYTWVRATFPAKYSQLMRLDWHRSFAARDHKKRMKAPG
jgi:hypothetical protein